MTTFDIIRIALGITAPAICAGLVWLLLRAAAWSDSNQHRPASQDDREIQHGGKK